MSPISGAKTSGSKGMTTHSHKRTYHFRSLCAASFRVFFSSTLSGYFSFHAPISTSFMPCPFPTHTPHNSRQSHRYHGLTFSSPPTLYTTAFLFHPSLALYPLLFFFLGSSPWYTIRDQIQTQRRVTPAPAIG